MKSESPMAGLLRTLQRGRDMPKKQRTAEEMREDRLGGSPTELWVDGVKVWDRGDEEESKQSTPQDVIKRILARGPRKVK